MMKKDTLKMIALGALSFYALAACDKGHDHDHEHGDGTHTHEDAKADDGKEKDHDHHHDHDHDHDKIVAGPSGGRVLTSVEPHLEFFVTDDRKVQISQMSEELKAEPIGTQVVTMVAGDRANPTEIAFVKTGDVLVSDKALPEGNDFPVVIDIKASAEGEKTREKFNLNLADYPECDNKEYACTCDHAH